MSSTDTCIQSNFETLYLPIHSALFRTALMMTRNRHTAEDALQDAVTKGLKSFSKLRNQNHFKTWMTRIVINACHDVTKKQPDDMPLDYIEDIAHARGDHVIEFEVIDAVAQLDSKAREIVTLRFWAGLSLEEIAKTKALPLGTVKSRLSRALDKLRTALS